MQRASGRVLIFLPNAIGDVLVALPMLEALSSAGWQCDVIIDEQAAGLSGLYARWVSKERVLPLRRWRHASPLHDLVSRARLTVSVCRDHYDALICMSGVGSLSAWLALVAKIPIRITEKRRESAPLKRLFRRLIFSHMQDLGSDCNNTRRAHVAAQHLTLLQPLGINAALDGRRIVRHRSPRGLEASVRRKAVIVIAPEASERGRCLSQKEIILIVEDLMATGQDFDIRLAGLPGGVAEQAAIKLHIGAYIGLPLNGLVDAICDADCVIAVDSGPGHIAAACNVPLVSIFGPGNPVTFRPIGDPAATALISKGLPCQPCLKNGCNGSGTAACLEDIPTGNVVLAVLGFLNRAEEFSAGMGGGMKECGAGSQKLSGKSS